MKQINLKAGEINQCSCLILVTIVLLFIFSFKVSAFYNQFGILDVTARYKQNNQTILYIRNNPIELAGIIIDASTNKPIANARIQIVNPVFSGSSIVYKTDEEGNYSIPVADSTEKRTVSLFIAAADYQETTIKISFEDYTTQNNVFLSPEANDVVIVTASTSKRKVSSTTSSSKDSIPFAQPKKQFNFFHLFRKKKNRK